MVAVAVFLERGHLNAPHTSSLSQGSLLKAFLTQTQQHRTLPQWQPCLLPLKLHPVTRRSWTKHISLPPLAVSKVQDYRQHAGALLEKFFAVCWGGCVREFGGWQPSCSSLLEETHVEFGYVVTFEHAAAKKWHILYVWWTELKYLVKLECNTPTCYMFHIPGNKIYGQFTSAAFSLNIRPLSLFFIIEWIIYQIQNVRNCPQVTLQCATVAKAGSSHW